MAGELPIPVLKAMLALRAASAIALLLCLTSGAAEAAVTGRVVDASGGPIPDAVVFVQSLPPGVTAPPGSGKAVMDQIDEEFVPRVLTIPVGTETHFPNHDQIHHHVYSFSRTKSFEIPLYKGETAPPVLFDQPGAVKVGCNIHDWMSGVILVVPTSYFGSTDANGAFTLSGLPPGNYSIAAWHERSRTPVPATVQQVSVSDATAPITFTLDLAAPRPRPARGRRSYE
jgi:plastocyanin